MKDGHAIYPYKGEPLRDVMEEIQISKGKDISAGDKLHLRIERPLFHSGTLSTKAPALVKIYSRAVARISAETAALLSLNEGDIARISSKAGAMELPVSKTRFLTFVVLLSNNFEGRGL
jgi:predicted molibdopterin-dependent oxidoreductase YjgC